LKACSLCVEATSQLAGQTLERAAHRVARSLVERYLRSDGAAGFTPSGLLPAEHEQSDNRHQSIATVPVAHAPPSGADLAHVMTLAARDTVIAPSDIAGDLVGNRVRTGPDEPIVGRDIAIATRRTSPC